MDGLTIVRLSPEHLADYLYFFEHVAHTDYPEWDRCYCLHYCATDNREADRTLFHDAEVRREYAIRYVNEGVLQGYLAYADGQAVGWCNANDRASCRQCSGYEEIMKGREDDGLRVKAVFCFAVAPAMRGRHIATALLERVIADARDDGYDTVEGYPERDETDVYNNYPGHRELYRKLGFVAVGEGGSRLIVRKKLK